MIGIDLVDLTDPLLKERDQRSLNLVLHPEDRKINHAHLFWLLWTAKEAVFKAKRGNIPFDPRKMPIAMENAGNVITFRSGELDGSFEVFQSHILAVASQPKEQIVWKIFEAETDNWSSLIREKLATHLKAEQLDFEVSTDKDGLPILTPGNIPISLTHHGNFAAFAHQAL